ncbi:hypothetical protein NFI96_018185 [Prochilodus magdalenae]|nr:hypothetical protein NFI96_018185 [Prochilodus magdalenae]
MEGLQGQNGPDNICNLPVKQVIIYSRGADTSSVSTELIPPEPSPRTPASSSRSVLEASDPIGRSAIGHAPFPRAVKGVLQRVSEFLFSGRSLLSTELQRRHHEREYLSPAGVTGPGLLLGVVVQNMSFKVGQTLTVTGVPTAESTNFAINIGTSAEELALHMNPRFDIHGDQRTVVCNSYQGGSWCQELRDGAFPFNQGERFQIKITFTTEEFLIVLSDGSEIRFPNRPGAEKYNYLHFAGEVRIQGLEIK